MEYERAAGRPVDPNMTDDRRPKKKRRHHEDDGYFGWPPGYDVVHFLDADDDRRMSHEEWLAHLERLRRESGGGKTHT